MSTRIGADAIAAKGWLRAHQWLLLRRISQIGILALFLLGPWFGVWIVKGNLTSSLTLNRLPLTDSFVLLQTVFAGHLPLTTALTGAVVVLAFYLLVGRYSPLRIGATNRAECNDCMDCFAVCPEPQVIGPALKGSAKNLGPLILSPNCTNCGRCIDVCSKDVFRWSTRYNNSFPTSIAPKTEVLS